jgi:hypothetical protein
LGEDSLWHVPLPLSEVGEETKENLSEKGSTRTKTALQNNAAKTTDVPQNVPRDPSERAKVNIKTAWFDQGSSAREEPATPAVVAEGTSQIERLSDLVEVMLAPS